MPLSKTLHGDFDFSQLKQNWMGEWNEGVVYKLNDTVRVNGKAYVCSTTYMEEQQLFGQEHKPGVDTDNWQLVISGSVYKGDWAFKDRHYAGDVVRYAEDYYQCIIDNYGGHPIYENGGLTNKWVKIATSSLTDRSRQYVSFGLYPPLGWTRNMCESNEMYGHQGYINISAINGNGEAVFMGRDHGDDGKGLGERTTWLASNNVNASTTYTFPRESGFDMWDYLDGANTTLTGEPPKVIQHTGTDAFSMTLMDSGELYHAGYGGHGQSGDGTTTTYKYNRRVGRSGGRGSGILRGIRIIKVAHSAKSGNQSNIDTHSCAALTDDGKVYTWGYNGYGQLGQGNTSNYSSPTLIDQGYFHNKKIVDMWMSGYNYQYSYFLTEDGDLYSCGYNGDGALGHGTFWNFYRPERVHYNWKDHGGIKKIVCMGSAAENSVVVLTHNGHLHAVGNIGDASYPIFGAGVTGNTYVPTFHSLARLFDARANSLGMTNKSNQSGGISDVMRNVEEFWLLQYGGAQYTLIMKEKGTGLMWMVGVNQGNIPLIHKALGRDEYSGDNPMHSPHVSFPAQIAMGNMTDIKYVADAGLTAGATGFLNSDGRVWTNGYSGGTYVRGIGYNNDVTNPTSEFRRYHRLPWEFFITDRVPMQARWKEPCRILGAVAEDAASGFVMITSNGRIVWAGGGFSWYYGWDPASNPSQVGFQNSNYSRTSM